MGIIKKMLGIQVLCVQFKELHNKTTVDERKEILGHLKIANTNKRKDKTKNWLFTTKIDKPLINYSKEKFVPRI